MIILLMKLMMIYSYNILLYWYWSWRFTPITKSYRGEIKGDERWREVLNVEKEYVEMKVGMVELVENEMVELNVPQIGSNWGWGEFDNEFNNEFDNKHNTTTTRNNHKDNHPKPLVSLLSFSFIITFSYIFITISYTFITISYNL